MFELRNENNLKCNNNNNNNNFNLETCNIREK